MAKQTINESLPTIRLSTKRNQKSAFGVVSNCVRGLFSRGYDNPSEVNTIEFVEIATTGNGQDFGDCNGAGTSGGMAMSNGHGGL